MNRISNIACAILLVVMALSCAPGERAGARTAPPGAGAIPPSNAPRFQQAIVVVQPKANAFFGWLKPGEQEPTKLTVAFYGLSGGVLGSIDSTQVQTTSGLVIATLPSALPFLDDRNKLDKLDAVHTVTVEVGSSFQPAGSSVQPIYLGHIDEVVDPDGLILALGRYSVSGYDPCPHCNLLYFLCHCMEEVYGLDNLDAPGCPMADASRTCKKVVLKVP